MIKNSFITQKRFQISEKVKYASILRIIKEVYKINNFFATYCDECRLNRCEIIDEYFFLYPLDIFTRINSHLNRKKLSHRHRNKE